MTTEQITWATWTGRVAHATTASVGAVPRGSWPTLCGGECPVGYYRLTPWVASESTKRCARCEKAAHTATEGADDA